MPDEVDLLRNLGSDVADPDETSIQRARAILAERISADERQRVGRPFGRPLRTQWGLAAAAVTLLVGSAVGFGVASSVTPSASARGNVIGLGFIPAEGWNVVQSGALGETGVARAVAANVPIASQDEARGVPFVTLGSLPTNGVVIVAHFRPRGDILEDLRFPLRSLPLHVADALPLAPPPRLAGTQLALLHLRAAAAGYNVDARIFLGRRSRAASHAVDEQLRRLIIAPRRVTLVVQPTIISNPDQRMAIHGSVDSGKADQKVTIQFKACGVSPARFRVAFETTTQEGGGFSLSELRPFNLGVSGVYRALSGDEISAEVPVQQRAAVYLLPVKRGRFEVRVGGKVSFWRRFVLLQRFERTRGVWVTMRRLVLTEDLGRTLPFRPGVPKGTEIRAVLPLSQARPCYLAGVSQVWRT